MYKNLSIYGYRGFSKKQKISFAIPQEASNKLGLTMIVGGNNSGKSTILEVMGLLSAEAQLTVQPKTRNIKTKYVEIKAKFHDNTETCLSNIKHKDSVLEFIPSSSSQDAHAKGTIIKIPSRRHFPEHFYNVIEISNGLKSTIISKRGDALEQIGSILRTVRNDETLRNKLNILLKEITGIDLKWGIEVSDTNVNAHYVKFEFTNGSHSSEGLGEGLISLFVILLPFIEENRYPIITIDEPELSLHPALQRRLFNKLIEFSQKQQIIINTHSPYFVDLDLVNSGAKILRVFKNKNHEIEIGELKETTVKSLGRNIGLNPRHPQYFGLDMKEVLFAEDGIVLTEGQEDVICFRRGMLTTNTKISGDFFGWGAGSRDNIPKICQLLQDLKYKSIAGIFDNETEANEQKTICQKEFSGYKFFSIPTADIRDKDDKMIQGMFDKNFKLKSEYKESFKSLIDEITDYLNINKNNN